MIATAGTGTATGVGAGRGGAVAAAHASWTASAAALAALAASWSSAVIALGVVAIVGIGLMLAAVCLQARQESWSYPDAVAGALFLVSGAVFPLSVLPAPLQVVGLLNPLAWWIEGVRLALFPDGQSSIGGSGSTWFALTGTAAPDATTILAVLLATGALVTLVATAVFRASEGRAKDRGLLDRTTGS